VWGIRRGFFLIDRLLDGGWGGLVDDWMGGLGWWMGGRRDREASVHSVDS
jgi:hypothetical protein